jgi:tellurite resistance protein
MSSIKHLLPGWYAIVMGLAGLALAWHRATPVMGPTADQVAIAVGAVALAAFAALALATLARWRLHPEAWAEDRAHPVRHPFIATLPISVILLATLATALAGPGWPWAVVWWLGSLGQLGVTVWVLARWWRGAPAGGLQWAGATPAMFIPIVGNVLVPLAGVPLGFAEWSAAQFGIGLLFWPVVVALIVVRLVQQGPWPPRLAPTAFVFVAPPAVVGLSGLQFGAAPVIGWACWGMALGSLLWAAALLPQIRKLPFALPHWAISFPLAAFTALTLRLAAPGGVAAAFGVLMLALTSLVIAALCLATLRGLRDGSLLAPEPAATIVAAPP